MTLETVALLTPARFATWSMVESARSDRFNRELSIAPESSASNFHRKRATAASKGEMLNYFKGTIVDAIKYWKRASRNKIKFDSSKFIMGKAGTAIEHFNSSADKKTDMKVVGRTVCAHRQKHGYNKCSFYADEELLSSVGLPFGQLFKSFPVVDWHPILHPTEESL